MEWLVWVLFESFPALAAVLGTTLFLLLVYWRRSGRVRPLLIGLAVTIVLLTVQALVLTRREQAAQIMAAVQVDLEKGRSTALAAALAPQFKAGNRDRAAFIEYVDRRLGQVNIRWLDSQQLRVIASDDDHFTIRIGYLAGITGEYGGTIPSRWRIEFVKTPDGWKITDIECEMLALQEFISWPALDQL